MINLPLTLYVIKAAFRDRLIHVAIVLTALAVSMSLFVGDGAIVEKSQFILVYAAGTLRFLAVGAIVLFTAFYVQRAYAQREVEFLLSRPISRSTFILSHAVALAVVAMILSVLALGGVFLAGGSSMSGFYWLWVLSLLIEVTLMGFVALFFSMVLTSSTVSALMTFAFYVLARLSGQMLGMIQENAVPWLADILNPLTRFISILIPRFDLMTQSSWLIYGPVGREGVAFVLAQGGVFALLILTAAVIDLKRRQF